MASSSQGGGVLNWLLDRIAPLPPEPETPTSPEVDQSQWNQSVEAHQLNQLTVHQIGLIVFNESRSYGDSASANDTIDNARELMAHAVINADAKFGPKRMQLASTASPIEPSAITLKNDAVRAAYEFSMAAARSAYLSGNDPTQGATHFNFRTSPDRSNRTFPGGTTDGLPIKTQSGPFTNSFQKDDVNSGQVYVNTYGP